VDIDGNGLVFVVLGAAFAGVAIHLLLWSRRQSRLVRRFARERGLDYRAGGSSRLEDAVNACAAMEETGIVRAFSGLRDVVSLDGGTLFRATELLDLNPWGSPQNTHQKRTAVFFRAPEAPAGIFFVTPTLSVEQRYPRGGSAAEQVRSHLEQAGIPAPPCTLSLSLAPGGGIAYLEPAITGALSRRHLEYLVDLVARFQRS